MDRKSKINEKIILKRKNRDLKKLKFLEKKAETKSIGIQTEEIKKKLIQLDVEIIEHEIKKEEYVNKYKELYYGNLIGCNCVCINDNCEFKKNTLNKIFDKVEIKIEREKQIFFMDDKNIVLKIDIDNKNIKINYYKEKIVHHPAVRAVRTAAAAPDNAAHISALSPIFDIAAVLQPASASSCMHST